jgi:hypothetical protein
MLLALVALAPRAHAPSYDCPDNCCHVEDFKHSQSFYLKGTGGVEFEKHHVDIAKNEIIHWSAVLRGHRNPGGWSGARPNKEDYELYVGCGGCRADRDFVSAEALLTPKDVENPHLEPFTQTSYYPIYHKDDPILKFESKALEACTSNHFSVRLRVTNPKAEPFFWSPVLGCPGMDCEVDAFFGDDRFPGAIVEFPSFILRNQREDWNELYWPIWVSIALGFVVLAIVFFWPAGACCMRKCRNKSEWGPPMRTMFYQAYDYVEVPLVDKNGKPHYKNVYDSEKKETVSVPAVTMVPRALSRQISPRAVLYFVAMWSLLTSLFNSIFNMAYSSYSLDPDMSIEGGGAATYVGLILVVGHLAPMALLATIWGVHTHTAEEAWREFGYWGTKDSRCCTPYCTNYVSCGSAWCAHGGWSIVEFFFVGLAGFLWFGAGYYVFPTAVTIAAIFRLCWWLCAGRWHAMPHEYRRGALAAPLPPDDGARAALLEPQAPAAIYVESAGDAEAPPAYPSKYPPQFLAEKPSQATPSASALLPALMLSTRRAA